MSLRGMRVKKGLTQFQLSGISGVGLRMIQHYEQGQRDINGAKISVLADLAAALDCSISDLLTDEKTILKMKRVTL